MSDMIYEVLFNKVVDCDDKLFVGLGYVFMLLGNIIGVLLIIVVIIGYVCRDQVLNWLYFYYEFQICIFWVVLVFFIVMIFIFILMFIGFLGYVVIWLWVLICNVVGFICLLDGCGVGNVFMMWV